MGLFPPAELSWFAQELGTWEGSCGDLAATAIRGCLRALVPLLARLGAPSVLIVLVPSSAPWCAALVAAASSSAIMQASSLAVGQSVLVRYRADPQYVHKRLILGKVSGLRYAVLNPDQDAYVLTLRTPPLADVLLLNYGPAGPILPESVTEDMCYLLLDSKGGKPPHEIPHGLRAALRERRLFSS